MICMRCHFSCVCAWQLQITWVRFRSKLGNKQADILQECQLALLTVAAAFFKLARLYNRATTAVVWIEIFGNRMESIFRNVNSFSSSVFFYYAVITVICRCNFPYSLQDSKLIHYWQCLQEVISLHFSLLKFILAQYNTEYEPMTWTIFINNWMHPGNTKLHALKV